MSAIGTLAGITAAPPSRRIIALCLDIASKTGWLVKRPDKTLTAGVQNFTKRRGESEGMIYIRFRAWLEVLVDTLRASDPEAEVVILYEMPIMRGSGTTLLKGLETRVHEVAATRPWLQYQMVNVFAIKIAATGNKKASKEDVMAAVTSRLGRKPVDDNEADAVGILVWGEKELAL